MCVSLCHIVCMSYVYYMEYMRYVIYQCSLSVVSINENEYEVSNSMIV